MSAAGFPAYLFCQLNYKARRLRIQTYRAPVYSFILTAVTGYVIVSLLYSASSRVRVSEGREGAFKERYASD